MDTFIQLNELERYGGVTALYSTREACRWPSFEDKPLGDIAEADYVRAATEFGVCTDDLIRIPQVHSAKVRRIRKENAGEGIMRPVSVTGYDGMVTDEKGIVLCTVEADCVPVYLYDPVKKVIGMVHSGWKGTAGRISADAIRMMREDLGCSSSDIVAVIGPCICEKCYEVGGELKDGFLKEFSPSEVDGFFMPKENGKYLLDLKSAIKLTLIKCGIREENISDTNVCTFESEDICSWRRDADKAARMLTAIMLV
ncbi:MAG: peptidoglycan editing factor PgeF [Lachnospiraceae bacterium]|nr:peptidoglycan editing factor PgeF [Lachnospiraceae bacterium]